VSDPAAPASASAAEPTAIPEPNHGFDDSRRLTGANRYFGVPAVTLTPLGSYATDAAAQTAWSDAVRRMAAALGWPDPEPRVVHRAQTTLLVFKAPDDLLFTATEVNEWAWERAAASAGERGFDLAWDLGEQAAEEFAARAAAERRPELGALRAAAAAHGVAYLADDNWISCGLGAGSRCWPRLAVPSVEAVSWNELHDVPTVLVTGSNGKTTTARLIAAAAKAAGRTTGLCCTEGIFIDTEAVASGDYAGPDGARRVLRDPRVEFAVLETARGGILRRGLALERADVAIVTNISADHLGEYGIEDADDLAETKLVVAHAVRAAGTLVLNADDARLMQAAARISAAAGARRALFAASYAQESLAALRARGGLTCGVQAGRLRLSSDGSEFDLGAVASLPLTVGGAATYNVENLAAASLAAIAIGLPAPLVAETLARFGAQPLDNPGRLERWTYRGATVLIDYAHNPEGLASLLRVARALQPKRLLLLLGQAGNRDDAAIADLAGTAARFAPDRIAIKELPLMLRGRAPGEVSTLLERALHSQGIAPERLRVEPDELTAALGLVEAAEPGDVVVLPIHTKMVREPLRARLALVH
jgi:UDP-N-acetylmuramyl tripeptide synthase